MYVLVPSEIFNVKIDLYQILEKLKLEQNRERPFANYLVKAHSTDFVIQTPKA